MPDPTKRQAIPYCIETDRATNRSRLEYVATARTHIETSVQQLEDALGNMIATRLDHPIIDELREAILIGKRMLARSSDILKRIP